MGPLASATRFPLEVTHKNVKYSFSVGRPAPDTFAFSCNGGVFTTKVRAQPDGSLMASFGGGQQANRNIVGREEPLGLRITLDGTTCLLPNVFDPSELRTDVTGKVVRYLQGDGDFISKGDPYVEVEAMKMIMPLKATESGTVRHALSGGALIAAGDLIATVIK
jgi:acetyl-CoA carboxylase/biotin carboxylase 1